MSDDRPRGGEHRRPPAERPAKKGTVDIGVSDDDVDSLFVDETNRGALTMSDRIPKKRAAQLGGLIAALLIVVVAVSVVRGMLDPGGSRGAEVTLEVPAGSTITSFSSTLQKQGVIPSAFGMKLWLKFHDAPKMNAGEYVFHKNSSVDEALADIRVGPKKSTDRVLIPEGFRLKQIAERVGRIPGFSTEKFMKVATDGSIRSDFEPAQTKSLEGFLFPDTYLLSSRDNETTLIERMRNQFDNTARSLGLERAPRAIGHSPYETLVIASMIEAEAKTDGDRGKISQVIENRLNQAMPLQIDATLLYGLGNTKTALSSSDLKAPGVYNTYVNKGLPPGPIGNPGRKSLQAALAPTPGPWLYYVLSDSAGNHAFATTLDEHNKNVAAARAKGLL